MFPLTLRPAIALIPLLFLASCGGGSSGDGSTPPAPGGGGGSGGSPAPSALSYQSPTTATAGQAVTPLSPTVTGSVTSYAVTPALPAGLSLNTNTGVISGTPTAAQSSANYTLTATNSTGSTTFVVAIAVNPAAPVGLSYAGPVTTIVGHAMQPLSPTVTGLVTTYSISPALAAGLGIDTSSGVIAGTPAATGQQSYTITASNVTGSSSFVLVIAVNPDAPAGLSYASPITAVIGQAIQPLTPTVTGIVSTYSISPALPPGLNMSTSSGVITGAATSVTPQQTYTITAGNVTGISTFGLSLRAIAAQTADAGTDQTVQLGSFVTLDGSASSTVSNHALTFAWAFTSAPGGSASALAATSSMKPVFRADKLGTYVASLTVNDGTASSAPATVNVTVVPKVARVIPAPANNSIVVTTCRDIAAPGNYVVQADLVAAPPATACLSIHDTSNVVVHCNGHHVSDGASQSSRALEVLNVQGFTIEDCVVTTDAWNITDASDGRLLDNQVLATAGVATQASIWVTHAPRFTFAYNSVMDIALQMFGSDDVVVSDNQFRAILGHAAISPFHVGLLQGANVQILRNEFDGAWDPGLIATYPDLQNTVDDAIVLKDTTNALVKNNYMDHYYDAGVEWVGRLEGANIESNVIVDVGYTAIGGWYWGSVSGTHFVQNLADHARDLFQAYRIYGLRPANFDGSPAPISADPGIYFRNNLFDGNVQRNQLTITYYGASTDYSSYIPVNDNMEYGGGVSPIPGEVAPTASQFDMRNNTFIRNDFGHAYPGPLFGFGAAVAGRVIDGGQNICVVTGGGFPLACN